MSVFEQLLVVLCHLVWMASSLNKVTPQKGSLLCRKQASLSAVH